MENSNGSIGPRIHIEGDPQLQRLSFSLYNTRRSFQRRRALRSVFLEVVSSSLRVRQEVSNYRPKICPGIQTHCAYAASTLHHPTNRRFRFDAAIETLE